MLWFETNLEDLVNPNLYLLYSYRVLLRHPLSTISAYQKYHCPFISKLFIDFGQSFVFQETQPIDEHDNDEWCAHRLVNEYLFSYCERVPGWISLVQRPVKDMLYRSQNAAYRGNSH